MEPYAHPQRGIDSMSINRFKGNKKKEPLYTFTGLLVAHGLNNLVCVHKWSFSVPEHTLAQTELLRAVGTQLSVNQSAKLSMWSART